MSQFDFTILDGLGVGDIAGIGYNAIDSSLLKDLGSVFVDFGEWSVDLSASSMVSKGAALLADSTVGADWANVFCDEVIDALLKKAGISAADRGTIKKSVQGLFDTDDVTKMIGCAFSGLVFVGSFIAGVASGVQTHVVRGMNQLILPNTGGPNDALRNAFINDPSINHEKLRKELGIDDEWWTAIKKAGEIRAGLSDLGELLRRRDISPEEYKANAQKLGLLDEAQGEMIQQASLRNATLSDIDRALRTGRIDSATITTMFETLGFVSSQEAVIKDSIRPGFDVSSIVRLWNFEAITEGQAKEWAEKRGYTAGDFAKQTELERAIPPIEELRNALWRGHIEEKQFTEYLGRLGLFPSEAQVVLDNSEQLYSPSDLIRFSVREVFTPEIANRFGLNQDFPEAAVEAGERIGLTEETLKLYWAAHWQLPSPGQGFEMFHRGIIEKADLKLLLRALDVMPFWQERMIELSFNVLPRRVVNSIWRNGQLTNAQFLDQYKQLGFSPQDAQRVLDGEIANQEVPEREATKGDIIAAFVVDQITQADADGKLADLGYTDAARATIFKSARVRRELFRRSGDGPDIPTPDTKTPAAIKNDILRAYREDLIGETTATDLLTEFGLHPTDIATALAHEDNDREFRSVEFRVRQLKRIFDGRAIPDQTIADRLSAVGIIQESSRRIIEEWTAEREADELLDKVRDKQPTKADLRDWLVKGVIDTVEWAERMGDLGYDSLITEYFLLEIVADET